MMDEKEKKQYEEDLIALGDLAWKNWEAKHIYSSRKEAWFSLVGPPQWKDSYFYRRKEWEGRMGEMTQEGYDYCESRTEVPFQPEYFSGLNWREAERLVGKIVQFSQNGSVWTNPGILDKILTTPITLTCKYKARSRYDTFIYIRTCPETYYKHPTRTIDDVELPRPETEIPEDGTEYWVWLPGMATDHVWTGDDAERTWLRTGRIHLTKNRAKAWVNWWEKTVVKAMEV